MAADGEHEVPLFRQGARLVSFIWPAQNKDLLTKMQEKGMTVVGECLNWEGGRRLPAQACERTTWA